MNQNELMHYGILGMKWGVRRYQNKDGTLTKAGKRKAAKMKAEYTELTGKQLRKSPTKKTTSTESSKSIKEMSDTELREKANRLRLEKEYISAERERAALTPKDVNKGKAFVETLTDKVLKPALIDAGKAVVKNYTQAKLQDLIGVEVTKTGPRIVKPGNKPDKDDDKD